MTIPPRILTLFYYLLGGGTSVLVNIGMYALLLHFHVAYLIAAVLSFMCGMVTSFTLHKYLTFRNRTGGTIVSELATYVTVTLFNVVMNVGILYVLVDIYDVPELPAGICATGVIALWSFFLYKYVTFRSPSGERR